MSEVILSIPSPPPRPPPLPTRPGKLRILASISEPPGYPASGVPRKFSEVFLDRIEEVPLPMSWGTAFVGEHAGDRNISVHAKPDHTNNYGHVLQEDEGLLIMPITWIWSRRSLARGRGGGPSLAKHMAGGAPLAYDETRVLITPEPFRWQNLGNIREAPPRPNPIDNSAQTIEITYHINHQLVIYPGLQGSTAPTIRPALFCEKQTLTPKTVDAQRTDSEAEWSRGFGALVTRFWGSGHAVLGLCHAVLGLWSRGFGALPVSAEKLDFGPQLFLRWGSACFAR